MKVFTINLYDYFGFEKPENSAGNLTAYIPDRAKEYGENRLRFNNRHRKWEYIPSNIRRCPQFFG
jgi:hypothetical protein